jgi:polar amino acid transport system substrate-binding protein
MSEEPGAAPPAPDLPPEAVPEAVPAAVPEAAPEIPVEAPVEVVAAAPVAAAAAADPTTAIPSAGAPADAAAPPPPTAPVDGSTGGTGGGRNALIIGAVIVAAAIIVGALVVAQGGTSPSSSAAPSAAPTEAATAVPTATPEPTPTPAPTPTPNACAPENLATLTAGMLTIGADNPAYPPYFARREGGNTPPWEESDYTGDPTTGEGFEGATAYAVANALGFPADKVSWVVVPFNNSFAPGPKPFDFYITQVSYTPERAEAVDLSDGYYDVRQSLVALSGTPIASATTITELAGYKLGAQVGTTSYTLIVDVIKPTTEPSVYDSNDAAIEALKAKQIDGIVVDLPTADFMTNVQLSDAGGVTVGKFDTETGEHFSLVLAKGSPLTACVNQAIAKLTADGTLQGFVTKWLPFQDGVPAFEP